MRKRHLIVAIIASVACQWSPAQAWDGRRPGIVANLGLGPGYLGLHHPDLLGDPHLGFGASLRLGYAPTDQWAVTVGGGDVIAFDRDAVGFAVSSGLLARHYLQPRAPSLFVELGLGLGASVVAARDDSQGGFGLLVGLFPIGAIGYEVASHWSVELLASGGPTARDGSARFLIVTVGWLGY